MRRWLGLIVTWCIVMPAMADDAAMLDRALGAAASTFEQALPKLAASAFGVDVTVYRDALRRGQFGSDFWGGSIGLETAIRGEATGSCSQYAAFVRIPPEQGMVRLVLCPQFFSAGTDALRELTVLHEMAHVVAGADECRAMAFAAHVEQAATGRFTPVDAYWRANDCPASDYRLP